MRILLAVGALFWTAAAADETPGGLAQMVDSPALKVAFTKASSGEVELAVDVAADGSIEHPRIIRSTPPGVFDAAALDMVASRHMRPATKDGAPVPAKDRHVTLRFQAEADPPASLEPQQ
ncbi:MAG: energy transducer TonB [Aliidongia sp.]